MTEQQKDAIRNNPIHWQASDCHEVCTQLTEQVRTDRQGIDAEQAHEDALRAVERTGDRSGYLIWGYSILPEIERAVDAGAWDTSAAVNFFTR